MDLMCGIGHLFLIGKLDVLMSHGAKIFNLLHLVNLSYLPEKVQMEMMAVETLEMLCLLRKSHLLNVTLVLFSLLVVVLIKQILNAYGQAAPSHQPNDSSQSSGFYWNGFIKPGNCGPLPSQHWPAKDLPGFQSPSSSQVLGFQTQLYQPSSPTQFSAGQSASAFQAQGPSASTPYQSLSWHVSQDQSIPSSQSVVATNPIQSYQPNIPTQVLAGQSALPSQSMGALNLYQGLTSGRYLASLGQGIPLSPQPVATTNQISGFQNTYWPNTPVSSSQTISLPQSSSASQLFQGQTSGMSSISQEQSIPSSSQSMNTSSQIISSQTQSSFQPSTTTQLLMGQSDLPSQPIGGSSLYQGLTSGRYLALLGQSSPSSQSVVPTSQITEAQSQSFQPSTTTQALTGPSAISQDQSLQALAAYPLQASGWYTISQGQIPSQVSGFQAQSYQPSTAPQVSPGQSASPVQSIGASTLYQALTSGRYLASSAQSGPSSQSVVTTSQVTDAQAQSFQPSTTTQALSGQSAAQDQSLNLPQTSGWYTILLGKMIPSSQVSGVQTGLVIPSSSTQGLPGPSASTATLQPLDALTQYQMQGSSNPLFSQSVATTNQISGFQNTYWPNAPVSSSLPQSSSASQLFQGQTSGMSSISQDQSIPSSSQSMDTSSQKTSSQTQSSFQPSTTTRLLTGQSIAQDKFLQASYSPQTSGWYTILQGQIPSPSQVSGFQAQSSYQPSTTMQVMPGQSVSSQSMGASSLYQALTSGRYPTSQSQNILPSSQPMVTNQISGLQNTYWPNTPISSSQSISLPQSSSASQLFQGQTSGMSSISQDQSIPSFSQSMDTSSQIISSQTQSSFQPTTTTQVLTEQSALAPAQSLGNSLLCSSQTPGWYTTLLGKMIPTSQMSAFQTALQQPSSTSRPAASQAQSMGDSPLYQGLTSNINLTSQYQSTPSFFQSVAALNQISGIQNQSTYWPNTIQLAPSQSAFTPPSQSSGVTTMYQVPAEGLPSQDQSITASLQSVPSSSQISGFQNQTSYWPSATWVLPGDTHIAPIQSLGNPVSYPSQTSAWNTFLQSKIPSSQVSGFQAPSLYQPSTTQILAGQSDSTALLPSLGPVLYQGQALSRYNSQDQSFPSYFPSVATNQISGALSQPSFKPSSTTVVSASKPSPSQAQFSSASAWYQGPTFGSLAAQSQNIPTSSQSVVPTNQFSRFQNLMFQPNTAQAWSQSGSTPQGAPQKIAGITFQGTLPQLSSYGKKWPVTQ
ncbi:mucin-3A-like [Clarias gariepinus]|uniref:mucin-3A-like n=1 Tax=Clarias gariepinus TaxID=13013 RepID=UPI00234DA726|nr:mucin-3A-like [Clarias gariepinus]